MSRGQPNRVTQFFRLCNQSIFITKIYISYYERENKKTYKVKYPSTKSGLAREDPEANTSSPSPSDLLEGVLVLFLKISI
jgi:hypothetical protein